MMSTGILAALQRLHKVSPTAPTDNEKQPPFNDFPTVEENITSNVPVERVTEQSQSINDSQVHSPPNHPIPQPPNHLIPPPQNHPTSHH